MIYADVAQLAEQLICNQQVIGSSPIIGFIQFNIELYYGQIPEWPKGADCKSVGLRLRWFESIPLHQRNFRKANFSNAARKDTRSRWSNSSCDSLHPLHEACPCGSVVEHSLGKGEVMRSIRIMGTTNFFFFLLFK